MILLGPIKSNVARQAIKNIDVIKYLLIIYFQMCKMLTVLNYHISYLQSVWKDICWASEKDDENWKKTYLHNVIRRTWFG